MFTRELAAVNTMEDLAYLLSRVGRDMWNVGQDLECAINDLNGDTSDIDTTDIDNAVASMVVSEREIADHLKQFDKLLNRIIAERVKIGTLVLTVLDGSPEVFIQSDY